MFHWFRWQRSARPLCAALIALALAVRIAVPTGFMPSSAAGGVVVAICNGLGGETMLLPLGKAHDGGSPANGGECPFAVGLSSDPDLPPVPAIAAPIAYPQAFALGAAIADLTVHRLAAPPPPSHAPPARA